MTSARDYSYLFSKGISVKSELAAILSPQPASIITMNSENITRCAELARQYGVEMLFYNRLKKHYAGLDDAIDDYLKENEISYLRAVAISMRQEVVEKAVLHRLITEGIPACLIKGNEIARTIYEDPNCRSSADIDVLIKAADLHEADRFLFDIGFMRENQLPLAFCIGRMHHLVYRHAKNACQIELHWDFGYPLYFDLTPEKIWEGVTGNDSEGYFLTPENMVIMLLTHHFRHGFREFKILVDILWSFYRYDASIDWKVFAKILENFGLIKTTLITLDQINSFWKLNNEFLASCKILREQLDSLSIRPHKFLLRYFRMDVKRTRGRILEMEMAKLCLDRTSRILYSFLKVFFPRPQDIRAFYPEAKNWMLPLNYLRFFFWRLTKLNFFAN